MDKKEVKKEITMEYLKEQYEKSKENDEIIEVRPHIYEYKNEGIRRKLSIEADKLLPFECQLAIYMHDCMCKENHTDGCSWFYEIDGLHHDWTRINHEKYLNKARDLLTILDFETAKKVLDKLFKK